MLLKRTITDRCFKTDNLSMLTHLPFRLPGGSFNMSLCLLTNLPPLILLHLWPTVAQFPPTPCWPTETHALNEINDMEHSNHAFKTTATVK